MTDTASIAPRTWPAPASWGNQAVARYQLVVGRRIHSGTLVPDARHSWLEALSSAGTLIGLVAVVAGERWGDPVAGIAVTGFICQPPPHGRRRAGGVLHAHVRARWTGRTLRVEVEGWVPPELSAHDADALGRDVAAAVAARVPEVASLTWAARAA